MESQHSLEAQLVFMSTILQHAEAKEGNSMGNQPSFTKQKPYLHQSHSWKESDIPKPKYMLTAQAQETYDKIRNQQQLSAPPDLLANDEKEELTEAGNLLNGANFSYTGEIVNGEPFGRGVFVFADGSLLKGLFGAEGRQTCLNCLKIYPKGAYYKGGIRNGLMDGFGIFVEGDYKYQGHWSEGKPHGFGREFFQNGDVYRGNFIKGIKEGEGCVYWYNQESEFQFYQGGFKGSQFDGKGMLRKRNGVLIEGIFRKGKIENAVVKQRGMALYGSIQNNILTGNVKIELFKLKEVYQGTFEKGAMSGNYKLIDLKGRARDFVFINGKRLFRCQGLADSQVEMLLDKLEQCYEKAEKHRQALINFELEAGEEYSCSFIEPYDIDQTFPKYCIVEICHRLVLIKKNAFMNLMTYST